LKSKKLLFVVNDPGFFLSHRLPIALAAQQQGYDVEVATGPGPEGRRMTELGLRFHELPLSRRGANPFAELRALFSIGQLFRRVRPDIVHLVTIKPVLYGGLAARLTRVPAVVAAVSGLGTVFMARGWRAAARRAVVSRLYRAAFRHARLRVIFQNDEDLRLFVDNGVVGADQSILIPGSGVDLSQYKAVAEPQGAVVVTMASRLLRDKGVFEFVEAARLVRQQHPDTTFWLAGTADEGNPSTLSAADMDRIGEGGDVRLLGHSTDIAGLFARSHIVVLPSYREGLPRVLIEAAACGRAVVTTDVPGCRDAIEAGTTGLLVPPKSAEALAEAISLLVADAPRRRAMGEAARRFAEKKFGIDKVVAAHLDLYRALRADPQPHGAN